MFERKIKIILADDEPLFRVGISLLLQGNRDMEIIFEAANGKELIIFLQQQRNLPDIVIIDLKMPVLNGIDATKFIQSHYPTIKIIVLTNLFTSLSVAEMFNLGVASYLVKDTTPAQLINTIYEVDKVGTYYPEDIQSVIHTCKITSTRKKTNKFDLPSLTKREVQILQLICKQYSSTEIADRLYLSPRTVEGHKSNLLQKTASKNTVGLIVYALLHNHVDLHHLLDRR